MVERDEPIEIKRATSAFNSTPSNSDDGKKEKAEQSSIVELTSTAGYEYIKESVSSVLNSKNCGKANIKLLGWVFSPTW